MRLVATVPATSANLGAGFDSLALALDLCNEVTVDTEASPGVTWEGEGATELPTDGSDAVSRAMREAAGALGVDLPEFALSSFNRIPVERGLGSSAAAIVAGTELATALLGRDPEPQRTLAIASRLESHPDNVAAAVHGGLTIAFDHRAIRVDPSPDLRPAVLIPEGDRLATTIARDALPPQVSLSDASFNAGRAALAVVAITVRPDLLRDALQDRLHQRARLALLPSVEPIFQRLWDEGFAVCVSGAGPSLLAFEQEGRTVPDIGSGWRILRVPIHATGVEVREGSSSLSPGPDRPM
jgi:homoserine kinase